MTLGNKVNSYFVSLLFEPSYGIMHTVAFASGKGTNFREALYASRGPDSNYLIDLLITDKSHERGREEPIGAITYADEFRIEHRTVNGYKICGSWEKARQTVEGRKEYKKRCQMFNRELYEEIMRFEQEHGMTFDLAVLAGYMRMFKGPLLRRFNRTSLNVHPARLDVFNEDGTRKYTGE